MLSEVTSLIAGHLGAGALLLVGLLALRNALPLAFVRFCTASACGLSALAVVLGSGNERFVWLGILVTSGAMWLLATRRGSLPRAVYGIGAVVAALVVVGFGALASPGASPSLVATGSLSAALLLGATTVTMVLGHWYLVDTSLSIRPLRTGAFWLWIAVAFRWAAVAAALVYGGWEMLGIRSASDIVFSTSALFFLFRSLVGLGAPLLLAALVWQTVRIRSTQSATGLLYVAVILVLFGELISQFLRVATGYPL